VKPSGGNENANVERKPLVILIVGLIAGWLTGRVIEGARFEHIGDLVSIVGAFIGEWLLPRLGIHLGAGVISAIINATVGELVLLLIIGLLRGAEGGEEVGAGARSASEAFSRIRPCPCYSLRT
jgi:uncharacterized membrane protein YeaQ/YmgE (transglycosylase-associated protein family)